MFQTAGIGGSNAIERWVQKIAATSAQPVDWHFAGGRVMVLALGNLARVRAAIREHMPEHDAMFRADAEAAYIALRDRREALYAAAHQRHARGLGTREATVRDEVEAQRAASEEHAATDLRAHLLSRRIPGLHAVGCSLCAKVSA